MQKVKELKVDGRDLRKCSCGFKFSLPGELRSCEVFVTEDGKSGVRCLDCGKEYIYE